MSLERTNDNGAFTAESYRRNIQTIQAMQTHLEWMRLENEKAELERKVREGEAARQQLFELQSRMTATVPDNIGHARASNGPSIDPVQSNAYIEEVGYDHQLSSSRPTPSHSQPNTSYHLHQNGHTYHPSTLHVTAPTAAQNSANLASRRPHMHRQTTSISGPLTSGTNSVQPVHWQGGQDFRTSSLTNALGGTPHPPTAYVQSTGPTTAQPNSAATPNFAQSNNPQRNIAAQSETLSTRDAVRNRHTTGSAQSASMKQQQAWNSFSDYKLASNFRKATTVFRPWTAETLTQMLHQFKEKAPPDTHVDISELRLRVIKTGSSDLLLVIVDDQGQLTVVKDYSELQGLPQKLLAQIATLAIGAQTKTVVGLTRNEGTLPDVNPARLDSSFPRAGSQPFRNPLLPPNKLASESHQPPQSQLTQVFPASMHAAVPAVSRSYTVSPEVSSNGNLPNELANAGESSYSASSVPPPSNTLTPRAGSTLSRPRDAATSLSPSVLEGPRTPSHANKHTLARDVLRALGVSGKHGRKEDSENKDERAPKKRASTVTITGTPVTSTIPLSRPPTTKTTRYAPYGYNPCLAWTVPSAQAIQPYNSTSTHLMVIPNTGTLGVRDLSTTANGTDNSSSHTATSLLPVGAARTVSDRSAVEAVATPSSYPTSTQNPPLANKDTAADPNPEVSPTAGASMVQNNNATASTSRSQSPVDAQEGDAGTSKLPLFFRSSLTPVGDTDGVDDVDHSGAEDVHIFGPAEPLSAKVFGKRKIPYVLIPPPPKWVKEFKVRLERRRHETMFEEASDDETLDDEVDGFESPTQQEIGSQQHSRTPVLDPKEEAATRECSSRLREYPCKWSGCDSILNCADKLYLHLRYHVEQYKAEKSFPCHWQHCGRVLLHKYEMISHLQAHAFMPLYCAYENCEETFRTARQYLQHSLQKHQNDHLRPSADPVVLQKHIELPDVPSIVPSYMTVARSVAQYPISPERHQVIGLWTLQNIFGKVDLAPQRYNLAKPFRPGETSAAELRSRHEYDFIETKPPVSSSPSRSAKWESMKGLADLNSDEVTKMFKDKGLVLWGKGGDDDLVDETAQAGNDEEAVRLLLQV
ncbi:hypothetical protein DFS33DRAFT_1317749 [Desarmillaria ectypa]|nr:hypothetical protein DFS33DRAFT_1317749 [Desarmillaria ectypa]